MAVTNPYKANQHRPDPRQALFLAAYLDPNSDTFSNAKQSALKAGYSEQYSDNLTADRGIVWFKESLGDIQKVAKAEQNLDEFLELDVKKFPKQKLEATKFTLERLSKKKYGQKKEEDQVPNLTFNVTNFYGSPQLKNSGE